MEDIPQPSDSLACGLDLLLAVVGQKWILVTDDALFAKVRPDGLEIIEAVNYDYSPSSRGSTGGLVSECFLPV